MTPMIQRSLAVLAGALLAAPLAARPMESGPAFEVSGRYYDTCACRVSCSCGANVTLPSEGHCDGVVLLHIERGSLGATRLDGLDLAIVFRSPREKKVADSFLAGDLDHMTVYLDDRATANQRAVMPSLLAGLLGTGEARGFKPPQYVSTLLTVEGDRARFEIDRGARLSFDIENVDLDRVSPNFPRGDRSNRIALTNVAPFPWIQNVTQGVSRSFKYSDFGVVWEYGGRNAFFGTFATQGNAPVLRRTAQR